MENNKKKTEKMREGGCLASSCPPSPSPSPSSVGLLRFSAWVKCVRVLDKTQASRACKKRERERGGRKKKKYDHTHGAVVVPACEIDVGRGIGGDRGREEGVEEGCTETSLAITVALLIRCRCADRGRK